MLEFRASDFSLVYWYNEQEDDSKFKLLYHFYNYSMVWRSPYGTLWLQTHKDEVNREVLAGEILNLLDYDNWKCLLDAVPKNQKISFFKCQCQKKKKKKIELRLVGWKKSDSDTNAFLWILQNF